MVKKLSYDFWHHLILMAVLSLALFVFWLVSYSHILQFVVGIIAALLYVVWGLLHHYLDGDLHSKNMIEYVFIAILAVVILGGILL